MCLYSNNSVFSLVLSISLLFAHLRDRKWYMVLIYISLLIIENIFWCPSDITLCVWITPPHSFPSFQQGCRTFSNQKNNCWVFLFCFARRMCPPCPRIIYIGKMQRNHWFNYFLLSKEGKRGGMSSNRVKFGQVHFYKADWDRQLGEKRSRGKSFTSSFLVHYLGTYSR